MFAVILLFSLTLLAEATDIDDIELQVTTEQYTNHNLPVQLKCGINITVAISKLLPADTRITWYDGGFIPIPAVTKIFEVGGYHLRQIVVNISLTNWLQYGRYVCKIEDNDGMITQKSTTIVPAGTTGDQLESLFGEITSEHPGEVTVPCSVISFDVFWSKLAMDRSTLSSFRRGASFSYSLSSYDQSAKFVCHSNQTLYSIVYVHPRDYEPVRIIFPEKNTTIVFDNLDSKLIECKASGSLQPKISWVHGDASNTSVMLGGDIVKRIHVVDVSAYTLQLYIISPVPYIDAGKYTCVVENEWEVVNRSVTIKFELLRGEPFRVTTFAPVQYMFNAGNFTSRCSIQVDPQRRNIGGITVSFVYYNNSCNSTQPLRIIPPTMQREKYLDDNEKYIIVELNIVNVTVSESGCYKCLAASFEHTDNKSSNVIFVQTPFNITSYQPETIVEKGSEVTLSCEVTVSEPYDMKLVSVFYRYYANADVNGYVIYDGAMSTNNRIITANLTIEFVDRQHIGLYECYARSLPPDLDSKPSDYFYVVTRNMTLNLTGTITENKPMDNRDGSNRVTLIIIIVLSILSVVVMVFIFLLLIYIIRKWALLHRHKSMLPSLMGEESLLPASPDIPTNDKPPRQPSLLIREIVTSGWYFPHSDLKFEGTLGSGEFGIVMSALATNIEADKPVSKVAVKILPGLGDEEAEEDLRKELAALSLVGRYKHIVSMMGASYTEGKLEIIVEFCAKGSLQHHLRAKRNAKEKDFQPVDIMDYAHQIALGMQYLAEKKCVHCDLAARNILITEDNVLKVSDFGLARKLYDEIYKKSRTRRTRLPVRWMAIESIRDLSFTTESDVWAFGIVLWEIVQLGSNPYPGIENRKILGLLKRGYRMPQPPECPDEIYKTMRSCWKVQPTDRPSFSKLVVHLQNLKDYYSSSSHDYVNWSGELSSMVDNEEVLGCSDASENEDADEEKVEELKEIVCPVHGRLSLTGDDTKLLVKEQYSVDSGISNSSENLQKKVEATKVQYVNASNRLFKIHDRLRLQSADSGVVDNGVATPFSPTSAVPPSCPTSTKKQASRVDSGMPDSPCYSKASPPYTNIPDTFSHFPPLSPSEGSNAYSTDPTMGTMLSRRLSAHPDNRPMFPALGIKESDV